MLVALLSAIGFAAWWRFIRIEPVTSFIPRDPISLALININEASGQAALVKDLGEVFGDRDFFSNILQDLILPKGDQYVDVNKKDINVWFGSIIAIGKVRAADRAIDVIVVDIRNKEKAQEFGNTLVGNLRKKGRPITQETFRGQVITSIGGESPMHFAILPNHLLISERADGVRIMLDTERGRIASVNTMKEYRRAQRRIKKAQNSTVFLMVDLIEVIRLLPKLGTLVDPQLLAGILQRENVLHLFGSIQVEHEGATVSFFLGEELGKQRTPVIRPHLASFIPKDVVFYLEAGNARETIEGLLFTTTGDSKEGQEERAAISYALRTQYGLQYKEDLTDIFEGPYALALLPAGTEERLPAVLLLDLKKNNDHIPEVLGKLERVLTDAVDKNYPDPTGRKAEFTTHQVGTETYRFLNLPDKLPLDLAVKQIGKMLVITTTDEAMKTVLDAQVLPETARLGAHPPYTVTLKKVQRNNLTRVVYIDTQDFLRLAGAVRVLNYATLADPYKVPDEFVGITWREQAGTTLRGFLNIF